MSEIKQGGYLSVEEATTLMNLLDRVTGAYTLESIAMYLDARSNYLKGVELMGTPMWEGLPEPNKAEIEGVRQKSSEKLKEARGKMISELVEGEPSEFNDWGDNFRTVEEVIQEAYEGHEEVWRDCKRMGMTYEQFKEHAKNAAQAAINGGEIGTKTKQVYQTILDGTFTLPPEKTPDSRTQEEVDDFMAARYDQVYAIKRISGKTDAEIHDEYMAEVNKHLSNRSILSDKEENYLERALANNGPLHVTAVQESVETE